MFDEKYRPVFEYMSEIMDDDKKLNVYENIDMKIIDELFKKQKKLKFNNMMQKSKQTRKKVDPILIIYDDVITDRQLSYGSKLDGFTALSRHASIMNVFLIQNWTSIPATAR